MRRIRTLANRVYLCCAKSIQFYSIGEQNQDPPKLTTTSNRHLDATTPSRDIKFGISDQIRTGNFHLERVAA